jgi:DNA-binding NtrC family response regulator
MPTLEERLEDIPLLLHHFVTDMAKQYNRPAPEIDVDVPDYLMDQRWPGNVRQLRHMVERAMVFADDGRLKVADFQRGSSYGGTPRKAPVASAPAPVATPHVASGGNLKDSLDALENQLIQDALIRCKGNKKKAAETLGVSRSYLYKKLEEIGD